MLSFFPRGVLDEILNLIESVSGEFPSYSYFSYSVARKIALGSFIDMFLSKLHRQHQPKLFSKIMSYYENLVIFLKSRSTTILIISAIIPRSCDLGSDPTESRVKQVDI